MVDGLAWLLNDAFELRFAAGQASSDSPVHFFENCDVIKTISASFDTISLSHCCLYSQTNTLIYNK